MSNASHRTKFRDSLFTKGEFTITFELVPSRGGRSKGQARILQFAQEAASDGKLHAVSITDNAGGHAVLSPIILGIEIQNLGLDVIAHFSCKDKNRNQIESILFGWDRAGLDNLLVLTGDYPQKGFQGHPRPVFDLDVIHVLDLISQMNCGQSQNGLCGLQPSTAADPQTSFLKGVAVSPFKRLRSEQLMQYHKLKLKIANGAEYIITQLGFDARKYHELLTFMGQEQIDIPVLGNVFVPNMPVVEHLYRGTIPGCLIPSRLYQTMKSEAENSKDNGHKARLVRAAKLMAIQKGLGFDGVHLGGCGLTYQDVKFIIDASGVYDTEWQDLLPEFDNWFEDDAYLYQKDHQSGLNTTRQRPTPPETKKPSLHFQFSQLNHRLMFEKDGPLVAPMKTACFTLNRFCDGKALIWIEHFIKMLLYGCENCGECRLADYAFLCPYSQCAKYLLNGPCGGSKNGWCEVYPEQKRCFYVKIFSRLDYYQLRDQLSHKRFPPRDWIYNNQSTWLRFFRDMERASKQ